MTDNEIIKAVECCIRNDLKECKICPYDKLGQGCRGVLRNDILDLINRQKARIKELNNEIEEANKIAREEELQALEENKENAEIFLQVIKRAKTEAVKELAERLKEKIDDGELYLSSSDYEMTICHIDNLVKEMTEQNEILYVLHLRIKYLPLCRLNVKNQEY